jgi:hypothetical protein
MESSGAGKRKSPVRTLVQGLQFRGKTPYGYWLRVRAISAENSMLVTSIRDKGLKSPVGQFEEHVGVTWLGKLTRAGQILAL